MIYGVKSTVKKLFLYTLCCVLIFQLWYFNSGKNEIYYIPLQYVAIKLLLIFQKNKETVILPGSCAFEIAAFVKYFIMPVSFIFIDSYPIMIGSDPNEVSFSLAIFLTLYEMLLIYLCRYLYIRKHSSSIVPLNRNLSKDSKRIFIQNYSVWFLFLFCIFTLLLVISPKLVFPDFYLLNDKGENSSKMIPFFSIIGGWWKYLFYIVMINFLGYRYSAKHEKKYFCLAILLFLFSTYLILGTSRWAIIFHFVVTFYLFRIIFNRTLVKKLLVFVPLFVCLFFLITIYKFQNDLGSDYSLINFADLFVSQLQDYFSGPSLIGHAIDMGHKYNITFETCWNDFVGAIPVLSKTVDQMNRTNILFNQYVISPDTEWFTQIIPATGLGYIYFGSMFAPIFTVAFNILGLHFDYKLLNTSNLFVKYVLIYCSLWGGLSICFNTQIPFGNVVVYIFPLYLFYRLFSKLTIKLA